MEKSVTNAEPAFIFPAQKAGKQQDFPNAQNNEPLEMYGYFPGGDPRDFRPDYELCTNEEVALWQQDCAEWDAGHGTPCPPAGYWIETELGSMHVLAPRYGIGIYKVRR